jgi:hypothetical protein
MSGLQTIIDKASSIQFDRRKLLGVQYTRSEVAKVSETPTRNPWRINVSIQAAMPYNDYRDLIERLDYLDRRFPETVTFSNNPNTKWLCRYLGAMSSAQINAVTVNGFGGNQLILQNLPTINVNFPSTTILFKAGDFIQIAGYPYPFTVVENVQRGNGSTVTLTTHRPNIIKDNIQGLSILVGNNVTFKMFCPNMPTYKLVPGATSYGTLPDGTYGITNNAYIEWSGDFQLFEWTGDA